MSGIAIRAGCQFGTTRLYEEAGLSVACVEKVPLRELAKYEITWASASRAGAAVMYGEFRPGPRASPKYSNLRFARYGLRQLRLAGRAFQTPQHMF